MILLTEVKTASGTAEFIFELLDEKGERLSNVPSGVATVSLRKSDTERISHELTHLPALFDPIEGVVSLKLSASQTEALTPSITTTPVQTITEVIGDVRIEQGTEINYFGPFMFRLRLPETYTGQSLPVLFLTIFGGVSDDNIPETSELTIPQVGNRIPIPMHVDKHLLIWRLATESDLTSVVVASDLSSDNMIGAFSLWSNQIALADGRIGKVLVSNQALTGPVDTLIVA